MSKARILWIIALAIVLIPAMSVSGQESMSGIRLINAVPDGPGVDLLTGQPDPVIADIQRFNVSNYVAVHSGAYDLQVIPRGGSALAIEATLLPGRHYTLAIVGHMARAELRLFDDNLESPTGGLKVRLLHLSPDAPAVDLRLSNGATVVSDVAFPEASSYTTGVVSGKLEILPTQVPAPVLASIQLSSSHVQSVFVVDDLASINVFTTDDIPVVTAPNPAVLPNTAGDAMNLAALAFVGASLVGVGLMLRRFG